MNLFKKLLCVLCVLSLICTVPISASASSDYIIELNPVVEGIDGDGTKFEFKVTCHYLDESGGNDDFPQKYYSGKLGVNNAKFELDKDYVQSGGYMYKIKMLSCDATGIVLNKKEVVIYLKKIDGEILVILSDPDNTDELEKEISSGTTVIDFNCKKGNTVGVQFNKNKLSKIYDGTDIYSLKPEDYSLKGVAAGEDVTLNVGTAKYNAVDVANAKSVTLYDLSLSGADADKYSLSAIELTVDAEITPRPITITANDIVITKGQSTPELTYTLSEMLIAGNEIVGQLTCKVGDNAGEYTINRGTLTLSDNYAVTFNTGKLTISNFDKATLTDGASGITLVGHFDDYFKFSVSELHETDNSYKAMKRDFDGKVIVGYKISFTGDYDGMLNLSVPVKSKYEGEKITVHQRTSSGGVSKYEATVIDGKITIALEEDSDIILVSNEKEDEKKASFWSILLKTILIIVLVILGLAVLVVAFFFGMVFFNKTEELKKIIKFLKRIFKKK